MVPTTGMPTSKSKTSAGVRSRVRELCAPARGRPCAANGLRPPRDARPHDLPGSSAAVFDTTGRRRWPQCGERRRRCGLRSRDIPPAHRWSIGVRRSRRAACRDPRSSGSARAGSDRARKRLPSYGSRESRPCRAWLDARGTARRSGTPAFWVRDMRTRRRSRRVIAEQHAAAGLVAGAAPAACCCGCHRHSRRQDADRRIRAAPPSTQRCCRRRWFVPRRRRSRAHCEERPPRRSRGPRREPRRRSRGPRRKYGLRSGAWRVALPPACAFAALDVTRSTRRCGGHERVSSSSCTERSMLRRRRRENPPRSPSTVSPGSPRGASNCSDEAPDLLVGRRRLEIVERLDAAAHGALLAADHAGRGAPWPPCARPPAAVEQAQHGLVIGGFHEVVVEAGFQRRAAIALLAPPGERDQQHVRDPSPPRDPACRLDSAEPRQAEVEQHRVGPEGLARRAPRKPSCARRVAICGQRLRSRLSSTTGTRRRMGRGRGSDAGRRRDRRGALPGRSAVRPAARDARARRRRRPPTPPATQPNHELAARVPVRRSTVDAAAVHLDDAPRERKPIPARRA